MELLEGLVRKKKKNKFRRSASEGEVGLTIGSPAEEPQSFIVRSNSGREGQSRLGAQ